MAENKLLEPDAYNEVAGKVVVNVIYSTCARSGAPFPSFLFSA